MSEGTPPPLLFSERQHLSRLWLLVPIVPLVVTLAVLMSGGAALETGEVVTLAVIAALVIAIGGLLAALRLDIEVAGDVARVRMRPFVRRTLSLDEIGSFEARSYRPIRERRLGVPLGVERPRLQPAW